MPRPSTDPVRLEKRIRRLSYLLDDRFRVPGTGFRVGWDGLLGLVPGVGDTATMLVSVYLMFEAWRLGAGASALLRMAGNVGIDWLVSTIPLLGDIFDFAWKSNKRNVAVLEQHLRHALAHLPESPEAG